MIVSFSEEVNGLVLGSTAFLDDVTDFDAIADMDFLGDVDKTGGSYDFANTLDLGGNTTFTRCVDTYGLTRFLS